MAQQHDPEGRKERLLKALEANLGLISKACREIGENENNHYVYYRNDPEYKAKVDQIQNVVLDFAESQLFKLIKEGDRSSIQFFLKYRGKSRGYTESVEVTGKEGIDVKVNIVKPKQIDISGDPSDESI